MCNVLNLPHPKGNIWDAWLLRNKQLQVVQLDDLCPEVLYCGQDGLNSRVMRPSVKDCSVTCATVVFTMPL